MPDSDTPRNPRLRLACARCQRRKIRCDGQYPTCGNCRRASAECVDGESARLRSVPRRIAWLEAIIRERLPDVDLSAGAPQEIPAPGYAQVDIDQASSQQQEPHGESTASFPAPDQPARPLDQRAHEIGLISVGANADQKYIGPSSGYFLARLLIAHSPPRNASHEIGPETPANLSIISDLVDSVQGPLPIPNRSLVERLSQVYFDTINVQWPILHESSFKAAINQLLSEEVTSAPSRQKEPHVSFQLYMVLAIAATVLSHRTKRQFSAESYCLSALQYLDQLNVQSSMQGLQCMLLLLIFTFHNPHVRLSIWHLNYQCLASVVDLGLQRNVTASAGISIVTQEIRTRLFWTVLSLDRTIATMMGRPIGLRDEACELRLPQEISDGGSAGAEPATTASSSVLISIHLFKLSKLNSELKYVANSIVREAPSYAYPPITDITSWQSDMLSRLDQWASQVPQCVQGNLYMEVLCKIRFHAMRLLLLRPSPAIPAPRPAALVNCYDSARRIIGLYSELYRQELLLYDWMTLHGIISGTITMLYCMRSVPELSRDAKIEELMRDMNISLSILSATGEYWSGARRARDILEDLGRSTLSFITRIRSTPSERDPDWAGTTPGATMNWLNDSGTVTEAGPVSNAEFPAGFSLPIDSHNDYLNWFDPNQQPHLFGENMEMDTIIRNLFDGFVPQVDNFVTAPAF
ncbi:fungal-specific transcription factor domain-containing protein [Paraphoma chrysanthemicola]|uniref:Fungal-specific transcription factor domain-containing protein n=1 Tax=Paraphoma chrysanthemicola TaxID=798071 RepID=A0A8K0QT99_9PLEO|nr:fungal-specific transcription factor domain-containing protein [Paraphoma chrysanthemicola]